MTPFPNTDDLNPEIPTTDSWLIAARDAEIQFMCRDGKILLLGIYSLPLY